MKSCMLREIKIFYAHMYVSYTLLVVFMEIRDLELSFLCTHVIIIIIIICLCAICRPRVGGSLPNKLFYVSWANKPVYVSWTNKLLCIMGTMR